MYSNLLTDVYSVFASASWVTTGYKAYPIHYSGAIDSTQPFIRISVLPAKGEVDSHGITKKIQGLLILSIYVSAAEGATKLFQIADTIDGFFEGKTLTNGTQFKTSYINTLGLDSANDALYRGDYTINFTAYGE